MESVHYVIIGGGTAGLVMAARLTEDPTVSVVVLEAGKHQANDPKVEVPGLMTQMYGDENYDWNFMTSPQPGLADRAVALPRGKMLGGSSSINFMMHSHASKADIDNWEGLGNKGWNFETLAPYFRKSETFNQPSRDATAELSTKNIELDLHGVSGPLQTGFPRGTGPSDDVWMPTFETLGLAAKQDPRKGATIGAYPILKHIDPEGKRSSAVSSYHAVAASRPNLKVIENALVTRIVLREAGDGSAIVAGVEFSIDGQQLRIDAMREVILAAGSVMSPKVLELSGIGPEDVLNKVGIETIVHNDGVGENLQVRSVVHLYNHSESTKLTNTVGPCTHRFGISSKRRYSYR